MTQKFETLIESQRKAEIPFLLKMGLTAEDAEDIFQEASIALYETISSQRLAIKGSDEAYLHGICQNMAHKRLDELQRRFDSVDEGQLERLLELTEEPIEESTNCDYHDILSQLLAELSKRDYALIQDFYIQGMNMEQIAITHGLGSAEAARTTKCRIISRLRERANLLINKYF